MMGPALRERAPAGGQTSPRGPGFAVSVVLVVGFATVPTVPTVPTGAAFVSVTTIPAVPTLGAVATV